MKVRQQIDKYLDQVDESFLLVFHAMLDTYLKQQKGKLIVSLDIDGTRCAIHGMNKFTILSKN